MGLFVTPPVHLKPEDTHFMIFLSAWDFHCMERLHFSYFPIFVYCMKNNMGCAEIQNWKHWCMFSTTVLRAFATNRLGHR